MNFKKYYNSLAIIGTFLFAFYGKSILFKLFGISVTDEVGNVLISYAFWVIPAIILIPILYGKENIFKELGISKGFGFGLLFGAITTAPMWISSAILGDFNSSLTPFLFLRKSLFAGFFEEILFRGFLFGLLFRKEGWGFIPAFVIGAVVFGLGHLYQGTSFSEIIGVFLITSVGAIWYSWLYIEWKENLWVPIFLHTFMNLSWVAFDVANNVLGNFGPNIFRILTIVIVTVITIRIGKKRNSAVITKDNFFSLRGI